MNKKLEYFFDLYCRNLRSYYGHSGGKLLVGLTIIFFNIFSIPLLVWAGLGIILCFGKTVLDYCTRRFTPEKERSATEKAISNASAKELIDFSKELLKHHFLSHSSKCVQYTLIRFQRSEERQIIEAYKEEKEKLASEGLGKKSLEPVDPIRLKKLSDEHIKSTTKVLKLADENIERTRRILVNYLKNNNNNGKKLDQLAVAFFKPKITRTQSFVDLRHLNNSLSRKRSSSF